MFALGTFVEAADAYCHRSGMERGALNLTDRQLTELDDWLTRSERWFFQPLKES